MENPFITSQCLSPEELAALLESSAETTAPAAHVQHVVSCVRCGAELELMKSFLAAEVHSGEEADLAWVTRRLQLKPGADPARGTIAAPGPKPGRMNWWQSLAPMPKWAFSLAAVLFIAAGALQLRQMRQPPLEMVPADSGVIRSGRVELTAPLGDVAVAPTQFSWNAVTGAASYDLILREVDGTELWRTRVTQPTAPATQAAGWFIARKTLIWQVIARDADGKVLAESSPERFRLAS